jgi:hypothetical protein
MDLIYIINEFKQIYCFSKIGPVGTNKNKEIEQRLTHWANYTGEFNSISSIATCYDSRS